MGSPSIDERLLDLYDEAPCGLLSLLPTGEILVVNRTFLSWTGYGADELVDGKRLPALLTVPSALLYETHCAPLLRMRGSVAEIALDLLCRDGTRLPVLFSAVAARGSSGATELVRAVVLHTPTRREYERELLAARRQAEEAAEALRLQREAAERKVAEQAALLQATARMAAGDLDTPVSSESGSWLAPLAQGLDQMRRDIQRQMGELKERHAEILRLNAELRHQIEQRSRLLVASMRSAMDDGSSQPPYGAGPMAPVLPRGTELDKRYRIEAVVGRGAMGTVYEVERLSDGRRLAAKVLSLSPDYRARARFAREAQLLAQLQHPNLITVLDVDITPDRVAYLIMELIHGKSLAELAPRYGDRDFMLSVLFQVADALATVHAAGVVHRDLKPANVLVSTGADGDPAAKLADFGISRLLDLDGDEREADPPVPGASAPPVAPAAHAATLSAPRDPALVGVEPTLVASAPERPPASAPAPSSPRGRVSDALTQAGALVGTLHYMAPELLGGANLAQPASDIFSFGLMAYEVLAGTLPFAEPPIFLTDRRDGELPFEPLDTMCRGLSPDLARLLERCLAIAPGARPTAGALSEALRPFQPPRASTQATRAPG